MDYFLIFRFKLLEPSGRDSRLDSLEVELLKLEDDKPSSSAHFSFTNLTFGQNFKEAFLIIMRKILEVSLNFTNIQLICDDSNLFTRVLPAEFNFRSLSLPYIFTNFVDWRTLCRQKYACVCKTLPEVANFLNLIELNDPTIILKLLLKKLIAEKALLDTDVAFTKRYENKEESLDFSYFRCVGLPFQISKNELVEKVVEPIRFNITSYGVSLIFEHGKFSGKAVLKVPAEFGEMVLRKDRMYIGRRYVEISTIRQEEYEGFKAREERQRQESRKSSQFGRRSRSSSSSSYSRSRSREKVELYDLLSEAAIKVRGLPYSLNSWDIEQIFKRFNFVRGSIKLGFTGERKSGEAAILFPNREEAERAMNLQGFVVQGRYLELRVINKQNYDRFK